MPDLINNPRYFAFAANGEGCSMYTFMYVDMNGRVTISTGVALVRDHDAQHPDHRGGRLAATELPFPGSRAEIQAEYDRIRQIHHSRGHQPPAVYEAATRLRLTLQQAKDAFRQKANAIAATLYEARPVHPYDVRQLDIDIQIALADARFNPAGVPLYDAHGAQGRIGQLWQALNPAGQDFDNALRLFQEIWQGRANMHYQERQKRRQGYFAMGVDRMMYRQPMFFPDVRCTQGPWAG
jgi:hypothetical protein